MGNQSSIDRHIENAEKSGVLQLSGLKLERLPDRLRSSGIAGRIRSLDLSSNRFRLIHGPDLAAFTALKCLKLDRNELKTLPEEIGQLSKLEMLSVNGNQLRQLPESLRNLKCLKSVSASSNALSAFPVQLAGAKLIDVIDLTSNLITSVPDGVADVKCVELNLNANRLNSISERLVECSRLRVLRVEENCLESSAFTERILAESSFNLLYAEGNLFTESSLRDRPGYAAYMNRYTAAKKKIT